MAREKTSFREEISMPDKIKLLTECEVRQPALGQRIGELYRIILLALFRGGSWVGNTQQWEV